MSTSRSCRKDHEIRTNSVQIPRQQRSDVSLNAPSSRTTIPRSTACWTCRTTRAGSIAAPSPPSRRGATPALRSSATWLMGSCCSLPMAPRWQSGTRGSSRGCCPLAPRARTSLGGLSRGRLRSLFSSVKRDMALIRTVKSKAIRAASCSNTMRLQLRGQAY
ncbi:unnamed protein product [Mycena citricolor]|uniref:Uncharacterized protein n=1 Tax=Mycena citricolor TaxID=2018698 RepID=A0AAD2JYV7_9AGAR|nr:unnamed protein product [Mycena citricolor]